MPGWRDLPALFRHSVVAIYGKIGGGPEGIVRALKIARDTLAKSGYLYSRGTNEVLEGIILTGKGWVRNAEHLREGFAGGAKDLQFEKLFKMIEPRLYELDGPGGKKAPNVNEGASQRGAEGRVQISGTGDPAPSDLPSAKK